MSSPQALHVENLHVRYGATEVLRGVSLDVAAAGGTAVLGPSGCGKTTLLRVIAGLVPAQTGLVAIAGTVTDAPRSTTPPEKRGAALVFQDQALWPHMTVNGNLDFVLSARRVPKSERAARRQAAFEAVGLPSTLAERRSGELSGGERQRVALARALVQQPRLLLLDEPLSGLDRHLRQHLLETLIRLRVEHGLAMLVVTHDQEEAFALADRVAVLRSGVVVQEGDARTVYESPASPFVASFVGAASFLPVERAGETLRTAMGEWPSNGAPDGPLLAVLRPEAARIVEDGPAHGRVVSSTYRGGHCLHTIDCRNGIAGDTGGAVRVTVNGDELLEPGTELRLACDRPAFVPRGTEEDLS